ncbi:MAG TPA: nuclear transport factor 2 family protein [Burkholderiaceae bacterium]
MKKTALLLASALLLCSAAFAGPKEDENKRVVLDFYEKGLNQKDFAAAAQYFGPSYRQHNPMAPNGIEGFRKFLDYLRQNTPDSHATIVRTIAEGDYVVLHVHSQNGKDDRGRAIVDIFRLENGKIVEHWDVIQPVPEKMAHGNGMF